VGTPARLGKVVGTAANTNPHAPIVADIASADVTEEVTVIKTSITSTSPQVTGDDIAAAAATNAGAAAATLNEANPIAAYSDDATPACSATDVTVPTKPIPADTRAPAEITTREETCKRGEAEQDRITTKNIPQKLRGPTQSQHILLPRNSMHQPVMRIERQFSTKIPTGDIVKKTRSYGNSKNVRIIASTLRRGGGNPCMKKRKQLDCPDPDACQAPYPSSIQYTAETLAHLNTCNDTEYRGKIQPKTPKP
jgi:hypothetical protein